MIVRRPRVFAPNLPDDPIPIAVVFNSSAVTSDMVDDAVSKRTNAAPPARSAQLSANKASAVE